MTENNDFNNTENDSTNSRNEKRFTIAYEKGNWWAVRDGDITLWKEEVVGLLNELHEENKQLQHDATILIQSNQDYRKENEQLKQLVNIADDLIDKLGSETMQNEWIKNF